MHLCALAEAEAHRESKRLYPGLSFLLRFPPLSILFLASNRLSLSLSLSLSFSVYPPLSLSLPSSSLLLRLVLLSLRLFLSRFSHLVAALVVNRPSNGAAAYIGGRDGIIVRRGPQFGFCGALTRRACGPVASELWARACIGTPAWTHHLVSVYMLYTEREKRAETRTCARVRCERTSHNIAPRLVGIGYRGHSVAVASFLAHYWPPAPISLQPLSLSLSLSRR